MVPESVKSRYIGGLGLLDGPKKVYIEEVPDL